jgi:hypothetical protein
MRLFNGAILAAALVSTLAVAAYAADPASTTPVYRPQVATNPDLPYSAARIPGPKVGPSNWIPSPSGSAPASGATPNTRGDTGYYSGKAFGPKPN